MNIRLLLVDDHVVVRMGMRMLFDSVPDFEIVGEADNALDAITAVSQLHPDVVLMDIGLPDLSGIEATRRIKAGSPETAVVPCVATRTTFVFPTASLTTCFSANVLT